jgi:hypothetical protein
MYPSTLWYHVGMMKRNASRFGGMGVLAVMTILAANSFAGPTAIVDGGNVLVQDAEGRQLLSVSPVLWGPGWAWTGLAGGLAAETDRATGTLSGKMGRTNVPFEIVVDVRKSAPDSLEFQYTLRADADTALTTAVVAVEGGASLRGATALTVRDPAGDRKLAIPTPIGALAGPVAGLSFGGKVELTPSAPVAAASDGAVRLVLASEKLVGGEARVLKFTIKLSEPVTFYAGASQVPPPADWNQWYPFAPADAVKGRSLTDVSAFLEAPAGKHGRVRRDGDKLVYNGKPISLWGLNVSYAACAPEKDVADRRAEFYARHGINSVRLHKYIDGSGWAGVMDKSDATRYEPVGLGRMDYFVGELKKRGIYVKLSGNFGRPKIASANRAAIPYAAELGAENDGVIDPGGGAIWHSTGLQDIQIAQVVNLLKHRNPHTNLTYAEDPAVAVVELINEESALFFNSMNALQRSPSLRKQAGRDFSAWLLKKYGSAEKLQAAWGPDMIGTFKGENLADESFPDLIYPVGNPWFWDPDNLAGSQAPRRQRLLDTMVYLYDRQNAFYDRFVKAIRDTGYEGEILASNWQAGRAYSHLLNLHSDSRIGIVDRHNYFESGSMLTRPGSGSLSSGMQQVAGNPFMLSEWIHVFPNRFGVEGPAIIGAYGMGLQGWDVSYLFQNRDDGRFSRELREQWDVTAPQIMGIFPAVSRQVLRGDVKASDVLATRYVDVESLKQGKLGFDDRVRQQADVKELDSATVPAEALAAVRSVIEYVAAGRPTPPTPGFDLGKYLQGDTIVSSTNQLRWTRGKEAESGYFTINTPGTQAVIGFAAGTEAKLADVTIKPASRFAAIYLSAPGPTDTLARGSSALVTLLGEARNTDMKYVGDQLLSRGKAPILLSPVRAELTFATRRVKAIHILDHNGVRTGKTVTGTLLDTGAAKSPYFEIEFAN